VRVAQVTPFLVDSGGGKNWLFVKVATDEGLHGWGECYTQTDRDRSVAVIAEELGRYLVGWDPFAIRRFTFVAYNDFASKRGSMDFYCAVSGLEQALWDIVGKALSVPVYNLLGGAFRDRIRVYANGWGGHTYGDTAAQRCAEAARRVVELGFTALKFDPFPGPWREFINRDDERAAVACVRAVREAVGEEVDLLVEVHRRLAPMHAVRFAQRIAEFHPFWYEEPVSSQNVDALADVRRGIGIPVVTGEELYTKSAFREVLEKQAADILNPDVCNCGGILELKEIAAMAEPYYVAMSPHNYNSTTVGLAATLQASAVMPNFLLTEYFLNFEERGRAISSEPFRVEGGFIALPQSPGIGIDLDEKALEAFPYRTRPRRSLR
jgi:galactonate dehydratase